jgi:uncharacterized cupredoxin-like copper-binding protein
MFGAWPFHRGSLVIAVAVASSLMTACGSSAPEVTLSMSDFKFEPATFNIGRAQRTILKVQNNGKTEHNLMIQQINVTTGPMAPGQSKTIEVTSPRGPLKFVYLIPGHEAQGMSSDITVDLTKK